MKITDVKVFLVQRRRVFVKVYTDEGITGVGEGGVWGFREALAGAVNRMKPALIGEDPMRIEYITDSLYNRFKFGGTVVAGAVSAIDIALWDIKGKKLGVPVYELLGGAYRKKIRCWGACSGRSVEALLESAKSYKDQGYDAIRINPTFVMEQGGTSFHGRMEAMSDLVHKVRETIGNKVDIGIEIHRALKPAESLRLIKMIEDVNVMFYEDPIDYENYYTLQAFAKKACAPLAVGERSFCIQDADMLLRDDNIRYIRPDVCIMMGITGVKKAAAIAESHYVQVIPHIATGAANIAASLHLSAAIPNFEILEMGPASEMELIHKETKEPLLVFDHGYLTVPEGPGLGIELADDIEEVLPDYEMEWRL